jgi:signal transduction histidine kinase
LPWAFAGPHDQGVTIGFLIPAAISIVLASLLLVRAARALPRLPLVELAIIAVMVTTLLTFGFADSSGDVPSSLVAGSTIVWLVLLFTLPDGRVAPAWSALALAAGVAGIVVSQLLADTGVLLASFGLAFGIGVVGQVWRYQRRSSVLERQATKWVLVGLIPATSVFLGIGLVASTTALGPGVMEEQWYVALSTAAIWLVPWCAAIGVLVPERGRADPVVHALIIGCGSILALAWAYFLAEPVVGARSAAAITAILVLPVGWSLRQVATRLVYGRDPAKALAALGESLEQSPQPADVAAVVARTVVDGLAVPYAAVSLVSGTRHTVGAADGPATLEQFAVLFAGEPVATIDVAPRHGELELARRDRAVLRRLAVSSAAALHGAVTLQRLQAARETLVLAREEERRRLRRDLHDDLAPALVALGFRAASASALLERDPGRAREIVDTLQGGIASAVERVREIAYDLRPPVLDDLGLMAALHDRLDTEAPGEPHVEVRGALDETIIPAAVQLAALRIAQEAVSNARRHAGARLCRVDLIEEDRQLVVRVADDGHGVAADARRGLGSRSIEERAAELGGNVAVVTGPSGTTVTARLPLGGSAA